MLGIGALSTFEDGDSADGAMTKWASLKIVRSMMLSSDIEEQSPCREHKQTVAWLFGDNSQLMVLIRISVEREGERELENWYCGRE